MKLPRLTGEQLIKILSRNGFELKKRKQGLATTEGGERRGAKPH